MGHVQNGAFSFPHVSIFELTRRNLYGYPRSKGNHLILIFYEGGKKCRM